MLPGIGFVVIVSRIASIDITVSHLNAISYFTETDKDQKRL